MSLGNASLKEEAKDNGVYLWQIADKLGIQDTALSKKLRHELPEDAKNKIRSIIKELAKK